MRSVESLDTSIGFTPVEGLPMSTRTGDVDPGINLYLLDRCRFSPQRVNEIINRRSGLLGVSGTSSNMKTLLEREKSDSRAGEAVALFCYRARKQIGALAASMGGLDRLVFTGGIGEHAPAIRARICAGLEYFGIHIDGQANESDAAVVSTGESPITVCVVPANEELMIARHTRHVLLQETTDAESCERGAER